MDISDKGNKKVRKPYTLSEAALLQRRKAAKVPRKTLEGNINAWKDGKFSQRAQHFDMPLKICGGCFFFELMKRNYDVVVIKRKGQ